VVGVNIFSHFGPIWLNQPALAKDQEKSAKNTAKTAQF
jgi:hypothetical protein